MYIDGLCDLFIAFLDKGVLQNICFLKGRRKKGAYSARIASRAKTEVLFPTIPASLELGKWGCVAQF